MVCCCAFAVICSLNIAQWSKKKSAYEIQKYYHEKDAMAYFLLLGLFRSNEENEEERSRVSYVE